MGDIIISIISAIVSPIINSVATPSITHVRYLFTKARVRDLKKTLAELNLTKDEVQVEIVTATETSDEMVPTERAKAWMRMVQDTEDVVQKINEEYDCRKTCFGECSTNCWSSYRIGKRAAEADLLVKDLISKRQSLGVLIKRCAPVVRRMLTLPNVTPESTELYLRKAINYLQDNKVGMIGIWGMGGVGKTNLLQRINNHPSLEDAGFDCVIWVTASQELNLDKLRKDTAKRVGLTLEDSLDAESQAQALYHYLKMKSFLLFLDDIWEPLDLGKLGIPYPIASVPKRKVVFTTRSETLCYQMMAYQKLQVRCENIKIECLQPEEAWQLFLHSIGEGMRSIISFDRRVCIRAEEVANHCGGLPLALVVIAQAMSGNKTWQEWEDTINSLNRNGIREAWRHGADPLPLLKVSYDRLPTDNIKKCFLSCALWPEDQSFHELAIIEWWLGMNLVDDSGDSAATCTRGSAIVQCLRRACLLEDGDLSYAPSIKMHDILREMALSVISDCKMKWKAINEAKQKDELENATTWKEAEVISIMYGQSNALPQHPDCPNLFFLSLMYNSIYMIPEGFFQSMRALTILDLSCTRISKLPPSIGCLVALQHLLLDSTLIRSVPMELGNLAELKRLALTNSQHLRSIPRGLISRLQKLTYLRLNNCAFNGWDTEGQASIAELVCSRITSLSLDIMNLHMVEQLSKNPLICMWQLNIRDLEAVITLPLQSLLRIGNTRLTLRELLVDNCDSLEEILMSSECSEEEFDSCERFGLYNLSALKKITSAGVMQGSLLRNIRFLIINFCPELKNATWILQFPWLESLTIEQCCQMEYVISNEEGADEVSFSNLRRMELYELPELCSFSTCAVALPSLKYLRVIECSKLDEAPFSHLKIRRS